MTSEKLAEHLRVAGELLANGKVSDAWAHACDALQLDSTDKRAVELEARVRKALEAQAARDFAREQEGARRAQEARAREIERASALTRARVAIENAMTSGNLDGAEQELRRADESINPGAEFADLRARLLDLRRETAEREEVAARREVAEGREAAARRDRLAEPVIEQDRRHEPSPPEPVASIMGQPRVLWAAAAVLVVASAALWLVPLALTRSTQSPPSADAAPATEVAARKQPNPAAVSPVTPAAPVNTAPPPSETAAAPPGPAAAEPEPPAAPPVPAADPTAATTGTVAPAPAAVPNETTVANFRSHVQTLLAKKDAERALSVLTEALAYAPADKGLRALSPKVLDQARDRASQERSKAVAQRASGRTKFKQAERTLQRAQTLAKERKTEASARAYFDAADLFASAAAGAAAGGGPARAEEEVTVPEAVAVAEPEPPPARSAPPPARAKPSGPPDPVTEAYVAALSRGDRAALLAVYPTAPPALLATLSQRRPGYTMRIINTRVFGDSRGGAEVVLTVEYVAPSGAAEGKPLRIVLNLEPAGDTWKIVSNR